MAKKRPARPRPVRRSSRWSLPAAGHPAWPIVRVLISTTALTVFLYVNASHFDMTEGKSIVGVVAVNLLLEGLGLKRKP